jgi:diguanylate cyclase (GGDEF)-like protein
VTLVQHTPPRRILVIDDNESIHDDFRKILTTARNVDGFEAARTALFGEAFVPVYARPHFQVDSALQGDDGVRQTVAARAAGIPFQVAFVDMRMPPGWSGLQTIETLWAVDDRIQTVICTAYSDELLSDLAQRLGNSHRLLVLKKPFDPVELQQLAAALCEKWSAETTARERMKELDRLVAERTAQVAQAALHDALTGLPNRAQGLMRVEACVQHAQRRPGMHFAVLVVDLDRFVLVNTTIGHDAGDQVLLEVVSRLRACLRSADALCTSTVASRLDGGRFMILLEDLRETPDSARVAQRILDRLAEPYQAAGQEIFITSSIGIATNDRGYLRAEDMLRDADSARARVSAAGGGIYAMFDGAAQAAVKSRLAFESSLRAAIRDEIIEVHYQPVVRTADGGLLGFEALVRWNDPELGRVSPADLIAVAEDSSIIHSLGALVFRMACRQQRQWREMLGDAGGSIVSVNLSPKQLAHPNLLQRMIEIMQDTNVRPEWMSLEITESALMVDPDAAAATLARLRATGMSLQLDDFGTGYSSLSRLHCLPLDVLKVDRSFVQDICTRREHVQILEAVNSIARAFDMKVTVEGVETAEQLAIVRRLDIDQAQGYLFGKPMPPQEATQLLRRHSAAGVR